KQVRKFGNFIIKNLFCALLTSTKNQSSFVVYERVSQEDDTLKQARAGKPHFKGFDQVEDSFIQSCIDDLKSNLKLVVNAGGIFQ
ncbi:hypothetical protein ABPG74_002599, partial [Tetrahymena malaccensis]